MARPRTKVALALAVAALAFGGLATQSAEAHGRGGRSSYSRSYRGGFGRSGGCRSFRSSRRYHSYDRGHRDRSFGRGRSGFSFS